MKTGSRLRYALTGICVICIAMMLGCGSSGSSGAEEEKVAKILEFTDMDVTTNSRTGLLGGRYVSFEVTGSVTNNTEKPINEDNLPALVWTGSDGSEEKVKVETSQDKLLPGETCDVTYEKELTIEDDGIPELTFAGKVEFKGLDEAEAKLNEELQTIVSGFADKDAKDKQEKEEAAKKKEDAQKTLEACKGLYAIKAYNTAKDTEYKPKVVDSHGVDVTSDIEKSKKGDPIRKATVTGVKIAEAGWLSDATVEFTIDYEDPAAKAEREAKEEEKRRKAEEDALLENATLGQRNALSEAKSYLSFMSFSHDGLVEQLEYEGYTTEEAIFGADNCGADWNEQAVAKAKDYLSFTAFSYSGLIDQLEYEKFTTEQATYGADNCGADWYEQAAKKAQEYLDFMSFSRDGLIDQLIYEGFSYEQAAHGADSVGY